MDIVTLSIGIVAVIVGLRVFLTRSRALKLPYICCLNFCIAALIVLYVKSPMGAIAAIVYFIFSTVSSNAIAHTIGEMKKIEKVSK
ncbi:DUF2109 domain-containing protein [Methanothermococcus okinawensis]|uniref:Uncharacterized protein n=1 Tax=Methanothermococcus okinawensis (strain DSM 14208 / JCM 11175 / IH1) TaxID=647113 RepID=F8ANF9_METOI|nr:DUF2109 domain-containing protein [Methanothermococcus okinawensis]AEH07013.1 Protein of unknown function DUF2109, membrane [Methanothermococcus okinawensis IH1]